MHELGKCVKKTHKQLWFPPHKIFLKIISMGGCWYWPDSWFLRAVWFASDTFLWNRMSPFRLTQNTRWAAQIKDPLQTCFKTHKNTLLWIIICLTWCWYVYVCWNYPNYIHINCIMIGFQTSWDVTKSCVYKYVLNSDLRWEPFSLNRWMWTLCDIINGTCFAQH